MEAKPHHPYLTASPPVSAQQPHITCHYRAFRVRELPEDYPYHLEPSSESSTKILVPYYEFRGKGPPPTDIGKLGDLYLDLADVKTYALYVLTRTGWTMWDPLPTQSSAVPPVSELIAHPQSTKLNRYLWCDGCQPSWYSLTTLGRMRSRMRQAGMYHAKGGLSEEYYSSTVAAETIRRMLEAEDTISPQMGVMKQIRKRPSSPLKDSESTHQRKKAKLSTHDTTSINSISEANVSTDRPLSWKIKLTPCYSAATPSPAEHSSGSVIQDVPNGITRALPSGVDAQDVEGDEEDQRVKALIEEKSLYEEENQRLKERVLQLTAQTDRLRDVISKTTTCMDAIKSRDIQRNSLSRSVSPEPEMLKNSIIISSTDILKTAGVGESQTVVDDALLTDCLVGNMIH
jgi:hypothetical protein